MTNHEIRETLRQAMKDWDNATPEERAAANPFAEAEIISQYTRADAIADGTLVDANAGDLDEVSRQHPNALAAMTSTLFGLIEKAVAHPRWLNDYRGVWHDLLHVPVQEQHRSIQSHHHRVRPEAEHPAQDRQPRHRRNAHRDLHVPR